MEAVAEKVDGDAKAEDLPVVAKRALKKGEVEIDFNQSLRAFNGKPIQTSSSDTSDFTVGRACVEGLGAAEGNDQEVHRCKALALKILNTDEGDEDEFGTVVLGQKSRDRIRKCLKLWPAAIRTAALEILDAKTHQEIIDELNE